MSQRRSGTALARRVDLGRVGTITTRVGLVVVAITIPLLAGSAVGLLADGGTLRTVAAAMEGALLGGSGTAWLFRTAALGLFGGCWLLGAGLLLEGLFD